MQVNSSTDPYRLPDNGRQAVKSLDKDAFLQLFITQLKNQDPMSPQDSNAFMAQMAQFSILEQLTNINEEMEILRQSQEMMEAASLIGRQVKVQNGDGEEISGLVEKVALEGEEVKLYIGGNGYGLEQVIEIM
ncbi:MAG: flagellar hook capping protein [Firmicutes bacterium]|nr:flagellar hook capping protein [Bacillota bacterium]